MGSSKAVLLVATIVLLLSASIAFRFEVTNKAQVCITEHLPKNQELVTQILVDENAKNFALKVFHMSEKGKLVLSQTVKTYNMKDIFVHQEGTPR